MFVDRYPIIVCGLGSVPSKLYFLWHNLNCQHYGAIIDLDVFLNANLPKNYC